MLYMEQEDGDKTLLSTIMDSEGEDYILSESECDNVDVSDPITEAKALWNKLWA